MYNETSSNYILRINPLWEQLLLQTPPSVQQYLVALLEDWQIAFSAGPETADLSFASLTDASVGYLRVEDYYLPNGIGLEKQVAQLFET